MNRAGAIALFTAFIGAATAWQVSHESHAARADPHADVVSVGSAVTEIVFALDQGHRLAARDSTSNFPKAAEELPDVGYMRALSAEGVLSVGPELILAIEDAGPQEVIDVLKNTGIAFVEVPSGFTGEAIARKIRVVGAALDVPEAAEALAQEVLGDIASAQTAAPPAAPRRAMFLVSASGGKLIAAGRNTAADAMIAMAGGVNAVSGYEGYKTLEDEAAIAAAPDVVIMMDRMGDHDMTAADLFALPALAATPAAGAKALIKVDGAKFLGFGPRTGEAVRELNAQIHGG